MCFLTLSLGRVDLELLVSTATAGRGQVNFTCLSGWMVFSKTSDPTVLRQTAYQEEYDGVIIMCSRGVVHRFSFPVSCAD
jgi:hypothetical protein